RHGIGYWPAFAVALASGLVLGALVERLLIRWVEKAPPLNAVIVTLGLLILLEGVATMIWGVNQRSLAPPFDLHGYRVGGSQLQVGQNDVFTVATVAGVCVALAAVFQFTNLGLRMRAAAFNPEIARMLGVRVGAMFTVGWALAAAVGSLAGLLIVNSQAYRFFQPTSFDALLIFGFTAAVIGGLESPLGGVVGGILLGLVLSYVQGYLDASLVPLASLAALIVVLMLRPQGLFAPGAERRV